MQHHKKEDIPKETIPSANPVRWRNVYFEESSRSMDNLLHVGTFVVIAGAIMIGIALLWKIRKGNKVYKVDIKDTQVTFTPDDRVFLNLVCDLSDILKENGQE